MTKIFIIGESKPVIGGDRLDWQESSAEWERIQDTTEITQLKRFAEHGHTYHANLAIDRIQVLEATATLVRERQESTKRRIQSIFRTFITIFLIILGTISFIMSMFLIAIDYANFSNMSSEARIGTTLFAVVFLIGGCIGYRFALRRIKRKTSKREITMDIAIRD